MYQFHIIIFIVRPVSAVRPSLVPDNLRRKGGITNLGYEMKHLTIKNFMRKWYIMYSTSHHDDLPLY